MINNILNITNIFVFFLIFLFFLYGLLLSEIVDHIFPDYENLKNEFYMSIEIIIETGIAYLIYMSLKYYKEKIIMFLFKKISSKPPQYLNELLLLAFSFGIYHHLKKSNNKILHMRKKYVNPIVEKIPFCNFLLVKS